MVVGTKTKLRFAEHRLEYLSAEIEHWQLHDLEVTHDRELEAMADEHCSIWIQFVALDQRLQSHYFDGHPYSKDLAIEMDDFLAKWIDVARKIEAHGVRLETNQTDVIWLNELRSFLADAVACSHPSDELPPHLERMRDEGIAEERGGRTLAGLVDG